MAQPEKNAQVVELPSVAIPKTIATQGIVTALQELKDLTSGMLANCAPAEDIARHLRLTLFEIAHGKPTADRVLALGIALEKIAQMLVRLSEQPAHAADPRIATLAQELQVARADAARERQERENADRARRMHEQLLEELRTSRDRAVMETVRERTQREAAEREREGERSALAAARAKLTEREREIVAARELQSARGIAELRAATDTLREQEQRAKQALADIAAVALQTREAHEQIADATRSIAAAAFGAASPGNVAERVALEAALADRDGWMHRANAALEAANAEMEALAQEDEAIAARMRTKTTMPDDRIRATAYAAHRATLDAFIAAVLGLRRTVEEERRIINGRLGAMRKLADAFSPQPTLPTLPRYPDALEVEDESDGESEHVSVPADASQDTDAPRDPTPEERKVLELGIALYELVKRRLVANHVPPRREQRPVGRIGRAAHAAGILPRMGVAVADFVRIMATNLVGKSEFIQFRGRMGSHFFNIMYARTAQPVPEAWMMPITESERSAFIAEVFPPQSPQDDGV